MRMAFFLRVKHGDRRLGEDNGTFGLIERANTDEGVRKGQEDVAFVSGCWDLWECKIACRGGLLDLPCGGTNTYCGS